MHLLHTIHHLKVCAIFFQLWKPSPLKSSRFSNHLFFFEILVEVRLHEPLWKVQFSPEDVAIEVLTLCSQLEPLCKKEYAVRISLFTFFRLHIKTTHLCFNLFATSNGVVAWKCPEEC